MGKYLKVVEGKVLSMSVLLSIKPEYVEAILDGDKKYEFRRVIPKKRNKINKIYLYSTDSVKKILGYFEVEEILEEKPEKLWKKCKSSAGIAKKDFLEYFEGTEKGYAFKIKNPTRFPKPIDPHEIIDDFTPPQSFHYISDAKILSKPPNHLPE